MKVHNRRMASEAARLTAFDRRCVQGYRRSTCQSRARDRQSALRWHRARGANDFRLNEAPRLQRRGALHKGGVPCGWEELGPRPGIVFLRDLIWEPCLRWLADATREDPRRALTDQIESLTFNVLGDTKLGELAAMASAPKTAKDVVETGTACTPLVFGPAAMSSSYAHAYRAGVPWH